MFSKERLMTIVNTLSEDPVLPQLSIALDPSAMKHVFQDHVGWDGEHPQPIIDRCDIFHTRYKRGRYCLVCYRLALRGSDSSHMSEQIFCARMFERGGAVSRFKKAQSKDLFPPKFGQPLSLIPELDMVVWAFPNDRKLSGLPGLMNQNYLRNHVLPLIVGTHLGKNWEIETCTPELVHYVGEHTCTIRVSVRLSHTTTAMDRTQNYFGKTYYNNEGEVAYQAMNELWNSEIRRSGRLLMAQPLWYDKELLTLWQCGLEGKTLIEHDLTHHDGLQLLKHAAVTVATLHQTSVSCTGSHPLEEQLELLDPVCTLLAEVQPQCQVLLTRILDCLRAQAPFVADQPQVTLHGDLHL
ncbi:MAG: aminoglycoside phosphotransferase family protein, partial [Nitrospirota bacterium]|nr:aminoglycoside phosphotransferase family protein [Nitrospirota bacterium]